MLGGLEHQIGALSRETVALSHALRSPNARGRWGELTLRRVAELAGMVPYCDFFEQSASASGQRPDMIVRCRGTHAGGRRKVPLAAYLDAGPSDESGVALDVRAAGHAVRLGTRDTGRNSSRARDDRAVLAGDHFSARRWRVTAIAGAGLAQKVLSPAGHAGERAEGIAYGWRQGAWRRNAGELRHRRGF
jgi:DNA recombination protein RmuC